MNGIETLQRIRELTIAHPVRILNVCGGHERTIAQAGLRSVLPVNVEMIPGPGCPVCVCPEASIRAVMQWGFDTGGIVVTFGDMMRVPINSAVNGARSLEQARQSGVDVVPIASPMSVVDIAQRNAGRPIVFLAVGFETTMAPVAAMIKRGLPENVHIELAGRRTAPVVNELLQTGELHFDALIAPGHVAAIMGANEWQFIADEYHLPVVVSGFTPDFLLDAIYTALIEVIEKKSSLVNRYSSVVTADANPTAKSLLEEIFIVDAAPWRGIGEVPSSGFRFAPEWQYIDAKLTEKYADAAESEMPKGCDCARVMLGQIKPVECRIYGRPCTPQRPIGPCMVSDEGACRIWWSAGERSQQNNTAVPA